MMAPYVIARTSMPLAFVSVKIVIAVPSGIVPNGASVTPGTPITTPLPDLALPHTIVIANRTPIVNRARPG
jgi:hypothetical protein